MGDVSFTGEIAVPFSEGDSLSELVKGVEENVLLPDQFRQDALKVAKWAIDLENDPSLMSSDPNIRNFVGQLVNTSFIQVASYVPEKFPSWLRPEALIAQGIRASYSITRDDREEINVLYPQWIAQIGYRELEQNSPYFIHPEGQPDFPVESYKVYIEGSNLRKALSGDKPETVPLVNAFMDMGELAPRQVKYKSEAARLVLYFSSDIEKSDKVVEALQENGIIIRGPAQDVRIMKANSEGGFELKDHFSNDQAWGESRDHGVSYEKFFDQNRLFSPVSRIFLDWYLDRCLNYGKSPVEPYKTSFVYAGFPVKKAVRVEEFASDPKISKQLAVVEEIIDHRYPIFPAQLSGSHLLTPPLFVVARNDY